MTCELNFVSEWTQVSEKLQGDSDLSTLTTCLTVTSYGFTHSISNVKCYLHTDVYDDTTAVIRNVLRLHKKTADMTKLLLKMSDYQGFFYFHRHHMPNFPRVAFISQ